MLGERRGTVMAGGHTHLQMLRQHKGMLLVNPGSVGMPFKEFAFGKAPVVLGHAEYAMVEGTKGNVSAVFHRVALDRVALRHATAATEHPLKMPLLASYA